MLSPDISNNMSHSWEEQLVTLAHLVHKTGFLTDLISAGEHKWILGGGGGEILILPLTQAS